MRIFWCDAIDACLFQVLLSTNYSIWFLCELCVNEEEEEGAGIPLFFFKRANKGQGSPRDLSSCDLFSSPQREEVRSFPEKLKRLLNHKLLCARRTCVYLLSLLDTI